MLIRIKIILSFNDWCKNEDCIDLLNYLVDRYDSIRLSYQSHTYVDWKCDKGHIFSIDFGKFSNPHRKSYKKFRCPVCSGHKILEGYNDLGTLEPDLVLEWDYSKNVVSPSEIAKHSHKIVWWRCKYGHEWKARVSARVLGNGCPYCSRAKRTSVPEQILYLYCKQYFDEIYNMHLIDGVSVDIYIPKINIAIEYDGSFWHTYKDTSYKVEFLKYRGIKLITISGVYTNKANSYIFDDTNINLSVVNNSFSSILREVFENEFGIQLDLSGYSDIFIKAKRRYYNDCNNRLTITDTMRKYWSKFNNYPIEQMSNDNTNKIWTSDNSHTFYRRYDVAKRIGLSCPFCKGNNYGVFLFVILSISDSYYFILDLHTGDVERLSIECLKMYILDYGVNIRGVNIRGVNIRNGRCIFYNYIKTMKQTAMYNYIKLLRAIGIHSIDSYSKCVSDTVKYIIYNYT